MRVAVILCAAGSSRRFFEGAGDGFEHRSKVDEDMGGRTVLQRAVELFDKREEVGWIIVAGPHDEEAYQAFTFRHADRLALSGAKICKGGKTHRYETVQAALAHVPDAATHIAVHDAARAATPSELLDRLFEVAAQRDAVIPAIDVSDTLKRVSSEREQLSTGDALIDAILGGEADGASGKGVGQSVRHVEETVDRTGVMAVQTPQVFAAELLWRAYKQDNLESTDDAQLVERLGETVTVVQGDERNIKITRRRDAEIVRAVMGWKSQRGREAHKKF